MPGIKVLLIAASLTWVACGQTGAGGTGTQSGTTTGGSSSGAGATTGGGTAGSGTGANSGGMQALSTTFTGTVSGYGLVPVSAAFVAPPSGSSQGIQITVSDDPDYCEHVTQNSALQGSTSFTAILSMANDGNYNVGTSVNNSAGQATFAVRNQTNCGGSPAAPEGSVFSGDVDLITVTTTNVQGTFNFSVGPQSDMVSGSFNATSCPGINNLNAQTYTCLQP